MKKDSIRLGKGFDKFQNTKALPPKQLQQIKGGTGNGDTPPEDDEAESIIHEDIIVL